MSIKPELHNHDFIRSAYHAGYKHTKCMQLTTVQKKKMCTVLQFRMRIA